MSLDNVTLKTECPTLGPSLNQPRNIGFPKESFGMSMHVEKSFDLIMLMWPL